MIRYRDATLADAALLEELFRVSFTDTFGHMYSPQDLRAFLDPIDVVAWEEELGDPAYQARIAYAADEPIGFCKIGPLSVPYETDAPALELRQLYILPPGKGRGIGAALIEWALEQMRRRGVREVLLSVYSDNPRAQRLYRRYGFEEIGRYHFMVGEQADDERIMRLVLEGDGG